MKDIYKPEIIRKDLGKLKVLAIFRTEHNSQILGGKVIEGKIEEDSLLDIWRDEVFIGSGKISQLQSGKQNVRIIESGQECGIKYEGSSVVQIDDILSFYKEEESISDI